MALGYARAMEAPIRPTPAVCDAAERDLFERFRQHRAPADRDALAERYLPLARQLARRYHTPDEPFDDLYQVACIGLIKAIDRYDTGRGVAFSSYATPTIAGELKRHFRDRTWSVRMPRDLQDLALRVDRASRELTGRLQRRPTIAEVAEAVGATVERVLDALQAGQAHRAASLQTPRPSVDEDAGETLGDTFGHDEDGYRLAEERVVLSGLLPALSTRDRQIVLLRFTEDLTQAQIGERMGLSQMHVSRILRQSLGTLRAAAQAA